MLEVCPPSLNSPSENFLILSLPETYRSIFLNPVYYFKLLVLSAKKKQLTGSTKMFQDLCNGNYNFAENLYQAQPQEARHAWLKRLVNLMEQHPDLSTSAMQSQLSKPLQLLPSPLVDGSLYVIDQAEEASDSEEEDVSRCFLFFTNNPSHNHLERGDCKLRRRIGENYAKENPSPQDPDEESIKQGKENPSPHSFFCRPSFLHQATLLLPPAIHRCHRPTQTSCSSSLPDLRPLLSGEFQELSKIM